MNIISHLFDLLSLLLTLFSLLHRLSEMPRPLLTIVLLPTLLSFVVNRGRMSGIALLWNCVLIGIDWAYLYGKSSAVTDIALLALGISALGRGALPTPLLLLGWAGLFITVKQAVGSEWSVFVEGSALWKDLFAASLLYRFRFLLLKKAPILLCLFWSAVLVLAPVYWGEYFYYLHGVGHDIPHPQFFSSLVLLGIVSIWRGVKDIGDKGVILPGLLALLPTVVLIVSPARYLVSAVWIEPLGSLNQHELLFGVTSLRERMEALSGTSYPQIFTTSLQLLIFTAGVLPALFWVIAGISRVKDRGRGVLFILLILLPGILTPLTLAFAFIGGFPKEEESIDLTTSTLEKGVVGFILSAVAAVIIVLVVFTSKRAIDAIGEGCTTVRSEKIDLLPDVVLTLLAKEDLPFFEHKGIDPARVKWVVRDVLNGNWERGASTITMQLAKVKCLAYEKTIDRKLAQIFIALYMELTLSKREILNEYLSSVPFAPGVIGIKHGAEHYFHKHHFFLTFEEALKLTMTIEDPTKYNPSMKMSSAEGAKMVSITQRVASFKEALSQGMMRNW